MRIAVVEDEPSLLEALKLILAWEKSFQVVGSYTSGEEALADLARSAPDIMVVDINLPGMSGIELTREVKRLRPSVEIIAFTGSDERQVILEAIMAGASGYILKGTPPREIIEAVQTLSNGGSPLSPLIARAVVRELQMRERDVAHPLSSRERDILKNMDADLSYKEIAEQLHISPHTVHTHIKNINEKLACRGRKEAIRKARLKGLI